MRKLSRFFENPFTDDGISLAEELAFTTNHLARMIANNPNSELDARITATTSSLTLVQNCATDDATKLAIRKARVKAKDDFRAVLSIEIGKVYGQVIGRYGEDAPEVVECFPEGRSIFSRCTDDTLATKLQATINGVTAHQADLGAPLVAQATAIKTAWMAVYSSTDTATANVTTTQEGKAMARANLQLMLFLNLVKLMEMFPGQPEKCDLYMQQSLLEDHPQQEEEPPAPPTP
jgi:hypothetical protein